MVRNEFSKPLRTDGAGPYVTRRELGFNGVWEPRAAEGLS